MLFVNYSFLFVFLPAVLVVYYALPTRWRNAWLLVSSLAFYASSSFVFLPVLLVSIGVDFFAGRGLSKAQRPGPRRAWLALSIATNLGLLAFFKYAGFLSANLRSLLGASGTAIPLIEIALPIGISFYTFQSMSYTIDIYRGRAEHGRSLLDFATFVALFPQLIAGPIVRYSHLKEQLRERSYDSEVFALGLWTLTLGLAKKLLVADTLAGIAAPIFANEQPGFLDAWTGMLLFSGQIYFDFSGYSDMAIGLGRMLGFEFPENFRAPYRASSFSDFWRRWHITLSSWLRDYLYIPLGGNRHGTLRTHLHLAATMLLGGLWHGASWNFLLWGALHGFFLMIERALSERGVQGPAPGLRRLLVFVAVVVAWTPFKIDTLGETLTWWKAMAGASGIGAVDTRALLGALVFLMLVWIPTPQSLYASRFRPIGIAVSLLLLVVSIAVGFGRVEASPFLYFRF